MLDQMQKMFREACRQIEERSIDYWPFVAQKALTIDEFSEIKRKAKTEAWLRIGEAHGLSRDEAYLLAKDL